MLIGGRQRDRPGLLKQRLGSSVSAVNGLLPNA